MDIGKVYVWIQERFIYGYRKGLYMDIGKVRLYTDLGKVYIC